MKKHLFLCLISLSLILCFTACDNSKKKETKENKSAAENSVTKTTQPKTEPKTSTTTKAAAVNTTASSSIAAEAEPKQPVIETVDRQIIDWTDEETIEIMKIYKSILRDEAEFFEVYENVTQALTLSQIMDSLQNKYSLSKFTVIDLDGDHRMELILSLGKDTLDAWAFLVFHYADKRVYEYTLLYHQLAALNIDGTFLFLDVDEGTEGIGTVSFQSTNPETVSLITDKFTYCKPDSDEHISYYVNHAPSTKEEFDKANTEHDNKQEVTWYDYTEENIEAYFSPQ